MTSLKDEFDEKKKELADDIQEKTKEITDDIIEKKEEIQASVKSGVTKTKRFFKRVFLFSLLALVLAGVAYIWWCSWTYSSGTRTGYLIKISEKGYVFKTYEGQINLGGFQESDQTSIVGSIWEFSLDDEAIYKKLEDLEGKKVTLRYNEINRALPWQGDTNYYIQDVEVK